MKRSRFSEAQIIGILKEHQAGMSAPDLCRKHGISDATFYNWRRKYGGMEVADAKRLKGHWRSRRWQGRSLPAHRPIRAVRPKSVWRRSRAIGPQRRIES